MVRHIYCSLIIAFLFNIVAAHDIHSVQTAFTKTTREEHNSEYIEGTLYFHADHGIVIEVTIPVHQWLISQNKSLVIYYPDDKYAFIIPMQRAMTFSFFQAFMGSMSEDFGLTQLGYSLHHNTVQQDTLITDWMPPEQLVSDAGMFTLKNLGDRIIQAELQDTAGNVISSSYFSDHVQHKTYYFPCDIKTYRYTDADTSFEHIVFMKPQFNMNIPDSIVNFKLPPDVEIQQEEW